MVPRQNCHLHKGHWPCVRSASCSFNGPQRVTNMLQLPIRTVLLLKRDILWPLTDYLSKAVLRELHVGLIERVPPSRTPQVLRKKDHISPNLELIHIK